MNKKTKFEADKNAQINREIFTKIDDMVNGNKSEDELLSILITVLVVFVGLLRSLKGDEYAQSFLQATLKGINRGEKSLFILEKFDKRNMN